MTHSATSEARPPAQLLLRTLLRVAAPCSMHNSRMHQATRFPAALLVFPSPASMYHHPLALTTHSEPRMLTHPVSRAACVSNLPHIISCWQRTHPLQIVLTHPLQTVLLATHSSSPNSTLGNALLNSIGPIIKYTGLNVCQQIWANEQTRPGVLQRFACSTPSPLLPDARVSAIRGAVAFAVRIVCACSWKRICLRRSLLSFVFSNITKAANPRLCSLSMMGTLQLSRLAPAFDLGCVLYRTLFKLCIFFC